MRTALVPVQSILPTKNPIAKEYRQAFQHAFQQSILPPEPDPFEAEEAPLYIHEREWRLTDDPPSDKFQYEEHLDRIFWDSDWHDTLVFIEGHIGAGKSTLCSYYLRCHCASKHKDVFDQKIMFHIDARGVTSVEKFDKLFFQRMREQIAYRFKSLGLNILTIDNYGMWDSHFDWDSKHHENARDAGTRINQYRAKLVNTKLVGITDEDWVTLALKYISRRIEDAKSSGERLPFPYRYIVISIDNVDQAPFEVHERAITLMRQWLGQSSGLALWQVYIPLWPQTLDVVLDRVDPLPKHTIVELGPLQSDTHLQRRAQSAKTRICNTGTGVSWTDPITQEERFIDSEKSQCYLEDILNIEKPRFNKLVLALAAESVRRELELWEWTACSTTLYYHFHDSTQQDLGEYALHEGLLTGLFDCHHRERNPIANLFFLITAPKTPQDMLVGPHVVHALYCGINSYDGIYDRLTPLGYRRTQLQTALDRLKAKYFIHMISDIPPRAFVIREQLVAEYWDTLVALPAYVDKIACTTPIEPDRLQFMFKTSSPHPSEFPPKVKTAIQFVKQLETDELKFCQIDGNSAINSREDFRDRLTTLQIPRLSRRIALAYKERLTMLRD